MRMKSRPPVAIDPCSIRSAEMVSVLAQLQWLCWGGPYGHPLNERQIQKLLFKQAELCEAFRKTLWCAETGFFIETPEQIELYV